MQTIVNLLCFQIEQHNDKGEIFQILMIDDRNNAIVRRTNVNNRFSESVPDYEDVKVRLELLPFDRPTLKQLLSLSLF
jgi:hypothetical protein